jgi:Raf kinase inhibitor-like YbhB/YbcL family protein
LCDHCHSAYCETAVLLHNKNKKMTIVKQPIIKDISTLYVTSEAFQNYGYIPPKYTCDGENINPPLEIADIPEETKSLVVIVDDPDAPVRAWTHYIAWNIPPSGKIKENNKKGVEGLNDFGELHYGGPCPPSGTHRYHFKIYALDDILILKQGSDKYTLEKEMSAQIIAFGELIGLYKRA